MGYFQKWKETRQLQSQPGASRQSVDDMISKRDFIESLVADTNTKKKKVEVTESTIMKIPTVLNCVELITGSIAQLPIYLYKRNPDGSATKIMDERYYLLNIEANPYMNAYDMKKLMARDYLINGGTYTVVERSGNMPTALYPVSFNKVTVETFDNDYYTTGKYTIGQEEFTPEEMIVVLKETSDGFTTKGILDHGRDIFEQALAEIEYSKSILSNGGVPAGILTLGGKPTPDILIQTRMSWERAMGGSDNAGKVAVLTEDSKFQGVNLKPNDLDLTNSKKSTVSNITKLFSLPESMINSDANKYASNESNGIQYLQYTISPILNAIESAYNKSLLLEDEKADCFWQFDTADLTRPIEKDKVENLVTAVKGRLISINEARGKLGYPSMPKDWWLYSLGDVLYNIDTNKLIVSNTGTAIDPDDALTVTEMKQFEAELQQEVNRAKAQSTASTTTPPVNNDNNEDEQGGDEERGN